ncbi:hypothetical protein [uncultured Rothia sp.]|jgi:hypothetical protein|uniref:hypothetical protein n=1 Tax=uncultured Rothia sp. TaxID=316088 RepID=UPI002044EB22|nr:hypothetical protein [uncultured Rothia sp.]DAS91231.1 MAG TPA: hypothetical protein [Caudoviricetes sp.]
MKREHCEALATCLFNTALILLLGLCFYEPDINTMFTVAALGTAILGVLALMAINPKLDKPKTEKDHNAHA